MVAIRGHPLRPLSRVCIYERHEHPMLRNIFSASRDDDAFQIVKRIDEHAQALE